MPTVEPRPMTPDEYAQIEAAVLATPGCPGGGCVSVFLSLAGGLIVGILLTTPVLAVLDWLHRVSGREPKVLVICGAAAGFVVGLMSLLRDRREWSRHQSAIRALYQQDLDDRRVNVLHYTVQGAIALLDVEGAPSYFLEVGDGDVLFLSGQSLSEISSETAEDNDCAFPCTRFNMVQAPHSRLILDVEYLGEPLMPFRTLDPEGEDLSGLYFPHDGELLRASLPTLIEDLRRLNTTQKSTRR